MSDSIVRRMLVAGVAALVPGLAGSACSETRDHDTPHMDVLPVLGYVEDVRIGSVDDPDLGFSQIRRVRVSDSGDVYVLDGQSREVRVFSAEGERLRVVGGEGAGPGEFRLPLDIGLLGDTLWGNDAILRRITWFGPDGAVLFTTPGQGVPFEAGVRGVRVTLVPGRPRPDGLIESEHNIFVSPGREIRPYRYPVLLFNRQGAVVDTLRWETADDNAVTYNVDGGQGFAPVLRPRNPMEETLAGGRVVIDWSVPEPSSVGLLDIVHVASDGDTLYHRRLRYDPIPVPGEVLDSLIEPRLEYADARGANERELEATLREAIPLPEFRPPVRSVHAGQDGTLWLELNTPLTDGADWLLIDGSGSPLGKLRLPSNVRIHHSAVPRVWAVQSDELDVPWLIRLRVE